ncbi:hypothetical protein D0C36_16500 [Mucilaginibacter conchicola]|uniref:DUF2268 domain-containing protein n=1 Tax=Mucilaginibacter conchicola TaxID=2303333 RepID=A0A372NUV5_9SPHI|nr:DUF5700 domain-containing putative Zn-dependent protease [Mucilaginibacter conchicola]RFZ92985.1 hypothetical protein D0C36_16500 [Mucilaginibacter conchicola]
MRAKLTLLITSLLLSVTAFAAKPAGKLTISLDFESAKLITTLLSRKTVTAAQIDKVADVYGSRQLIAKVKGYSGAGAEIFKSTLREIIETGAIKGDDPYNWKAVKANLPAITALIKKLSASPDAFMNEVKEKIEAYTSDKITANVRACFLVGGGSLGFTQGEETTFNVALQKIGDDYEGLKLLVAHELYHSIQAAGFASRKADSKGLPYNVKATFALLYNLWTEGTANLVGDFVGMKNPAPFSKTQLDEYQKNADRMRENFAMFEALAYKCYNDTAAKRYDVYYNIAFSTAFDETGYYTGYEMAKKIEKYEGKQALANMLTQDLLVFAETYVKLYKAHPEDKTFIRFDASTENVLQNLVPWREKM